jgi:hypothetical protein
MEKIESRCPLCFGYGLKSTPNSSTYIDCLGVDSKGGILYVDCGTEIRQFVLSELSWFRLDMSQESLLACFARGV